MLPKLAQAQQLNSSADSVKGGLASQTTGGLHFNNASSDFANGSSSRNPVLLQHQKMSQTISTGMNDAATGVEGGAAATALNDGKKRPVNFSITQSQFNAMQD